jgi:hypothetical protein
MKRAYLIGIAMVIALLIAVPALARSSPAPTVTTYDVAWYTIDGGGAMFSVGGSYSLGGSIGQPEAGSLSGGGYTLNGGFWGGVDAPHHVYLPIVLR